MTELLQAQVRSIGEHYVVARLTALGLIVGLAPENTRAVDIIAMSEDGKRNLQIQVMAQFHVAYIDQSRFCHSEHWQDWNRATWFALGALKLQVQ